MLPHADGALAGLLRPERGRGWCRIGRRCSQARACFFDEGDGYFLQGMALRVSSCMKPQPEAFRVEVQYSSESSRPSMH